MACLGLFCAKKAVPYCFYSAKLSQAVDANGTDSDPHIGSLTHKQDVCTCTYSDQVSQLLAAVLPQKALYTCSATGAIGVIRMLTEDKACC